MENGYENFVDTLRQSLLKETSYEEEMICYKKAEEYPPTSGDRLLLKNRRRKAFMKSVHFMCEICMMNFKMDGAWRISYRKL